MNSGSEELTLDEITEITDYIQDEAGSTAEIIWGNGRDESLADHISVTVIATGFEGKGTSKYEGSISEPKRVVHTLDNTPVKPVETPTETKEEPKAEITKTPLFEEPFLKTTETEETPNFTAEDTFEAEDKKEEQISFEFPMKKRFELNLKPEEIEEETTSNELETASSEETSFEPTLKKHTLEDTTTTEVRKEETSTPQMQEDADFKAELERRQQERLLKIRQFNQKYKTPGGLADMEKEPAFVRKNINLDYTPHSSDNNISRYTLTETNDELGGEEKKAELRKNNSYLHDNVD
jgi:cell division protein FtsZ